MRLEQVHMILCGRRTLEKKCREEQRVNWFNINIKWNIGIQGDISLCDALLKERFSRIYMNSITKKASPGKAEWWNTNIWVWNLSWRKGVV